MFTFVTPVFKGWLYAGLLLVGGVCIGIVGAQQLKKVKEAK
jgi:uncharacterized membrane-anchored protein YhcB (DUF1043 family)